MLGLLSDVTRLRVRILSNNPIWRSTFTGEFACRDEMEFVFYPLDLR